MEERLYRCRVRVVYVVRHACTAGRLDRRRRRLKRTRAARRPASDVHSVASLA